MEVKPLLSIFISLLIAGLAYKKKSLSVSGVLVSTLVGSLILCCGGWTWFAVLGTFFFSSSLLSHYRKKDKKEINLAYAKGGARDWGQVLANGGLGALLALLNFFLQTPLLLGGFIGAMATANADTWATELGVLSKKSPRLITNGRSVPAGTSGGVTWTGFFASLSGAALVGLVAFLGLRLHNSSWSANIWILIAAIVGGAIGCLFDSYLGATKQAIFYCPK